jgi:two-component sensor histidine kinase
VSARSETNVEGLSSAVSARLSALGQAHALVLDSTVGDSDRGTAATTLHALTGTILAPYRAGENIAVSGADVPVAGQAVSGLALLLHEFATNAAKYGALSVPGGRISISVAEQGADIVLTWIERGGPPVIPRRKEGFGTLLVKSTMSQLGGRASYDWNRDGLTITMVIAKERLRPN